jgi:hypothetical protein
VGIGPDNLFSGNGDCKNNNSDKCQGSDDEGPVPEGDYHMRPYDGKHPDSGNWWRLLPDSWWAQIASFYAQQTERTDLGRLGGYILHPGSRSNGCITFRWDSELRKAQYGLVNELLSADPPNTLQVVP